MPKITPFLWFNDQAEEAAKYYTELFSNSKILNVNPMFVTFTLDGQPVMALNGGPQYKLNEAFSFFVECQDQAEVDKYWDQLVTDGGEAGECGWLKDKYGLSWQIIPKQLGELMGGSDREGVGRVMTTMRAMKKIIVANLQSAYNQT